MSDLAIGRVRLRAIAGAAVALLATVGLIGACGGSTSKKAALPKGATRAAGSAAPATWEAHATGTSKDLWGVSFADARYGWAVGAGGTILATADGAQTWKPQQSGVPSRVLTHTAFLDRSHGWAVGTAGTILVTSNGGETWTSQKSGHRQGPLRRVVRRRQPRVGRR